MLKTRFTSKLSGALAGMMLLSLLAGLAPALAVPPSEVTAEDSEALASYLAEPAVSVIHLDGTRTYELEGTTISRNVTIDGQGAEVIATGGVSNVTFIRSAVGGMAYSNFSSLLYIEGTGGLTVRDVHFRSQDGLMLSNVIGVKSGGTLTADRISLDNFFNNRDYLTDPDRKNEDRNSIGILIENGATGTVTDSTFGAGNAFRQAIGVYGDADIKGNHFTGTNEPGRLKYADGYEYAIYTYGGNVDIENNTMTGYDSTNQPGYGSAGLGLISFYESSVTIQDNKFEGNSDSIGITGKWTGFSNGALSVNGRLVISPSFQYPTDQEIQDCEVDGNCTDPYDYENIWEISQSILDNNTFVDSGIPGVGRLTIVMDQDDEVEIEGGYSPLGGYFQSLLRVVDQGGDWVKLAFPTDAENKLLLKAADFVRIEKQVGDAWVAAGPAIDLTELRSNNADLEATIDGLTSGQDYKLRLKLIHHTQADGGTPPVRNVITYSGPLSIDKTPPAAPAVAAPLPNAALGSLRPVLSGTAEAGSAVTVTLDDTDYAATVDAAGNWSFRPSVDLSEDMHTFTVKAKDQAGNLSEASEARSFVVDVTPPAAPAIVAPVDRASFTEALPVISGTAEPNSAVTVDIDGAEVGVIADDGGNWSYTVQTALSVGSHTISAKAADAAGNVSASSDVLTVTRYVPTPSQQTGAGTKTESADILVNGKAESAGTATTVEQGGRTVTKIAIDAKKLADKLTAAGPGAVVTIPVKAGSDTIVGQLEGASVQQMVYSAAYLQLQTPTASYKFPAREIDLAALQSQLGQAVGLQDIQLRIEIAKASSAAVQAAEQAAREAGATLAVEPMQFSASAAYGGKSAELKEFADYVERSIAIPSGVDPKRITTGVVFEADGSVRHVPTTVVQSDGRYWAQINSLTNSLYGIIWHPLQYADVAGKWSENAVNDMASRLIVVEDAKGVFNPSRSMTRGEFVASLVRALGLPTFTASSSSFNDLKAGDRHAGEIEAAYARGLVQGFADGSFRPEAGVTRQEAILIVSNAMAITGLTDKLAAPSAAETLRSYRDSAKIAGWARDGIALAIASGVVVGRDGDALVPGAPVTKAETAALLQRLLQKSELI
ncbi:S-layer homology domain-containing protein [Cohnella rhizosphaerae]|uniref:S-layer homology domain-containing protein n=1 Tax=Cohnella rhizosphaerae TaxID=1457232 RepID=A0A9X4KTI7_9BACL|nr:Ig-like domain-containing protein [Cohnella rhizosphaerae]MDG0809971.1 S-layer homology domain-containing protein [Cohnella rhizosphaerae]